MEEFVHACLEPFQLRLPVFPVRAVDIKTIRLIPAGYTARFLSEPADLIAQFTQYLVPKVPSMQRVDGMEPFNIHDDRVPWLLGMFATKPAGVYEEKVPVIQPGQMVVFRFGNNLTAFFRFFFRLHIPYLHPENYGDNAGNQSHYVAQIVSHKIGQRNLRIPERIIVQRGIERRFRNDMIDFIKDRIQAVVFFADCKR